MQQHPCVSLKLNRTTCKFKNGGEGGTDRKLQQNMDRTVNAMAGSTFDKKKKKEKKLIRNCFWRIKFQGCVLAYSGLKLRSEYTKIVWVGRSHTHTHTHTALAHTRTLIEQTKQNNQKFKEHQQALYC